MINISIIVPRTHVKVEIPYVVGRKKVDSDELKHHMQELLEEALESTIYETENWIDVNVAKRSGDLRENLKKYLNRSKPPPTITNELRGIRLVLGVGVEIPYAKFVNQMTMAMVRHYNTWFEHSGKRAYSKGHPVLLDDPRALGFYHNKMIEFAKERLDMNISKARYKFNIGE